MEGIKVWYDEDGDYLEFSMTKKKGIFEDDGRGIFRRIDPKTKDVIGFGVINFKKKLRKNKHIDLPIKIKVV
ncbi:MAG: hypothetical protein HYU56_03590 [Candidatus Aenigmarchaeota archaeon]|nr:hypothetical protein [Candidatus Aenigmarchaeota archaeon]